MHLIGYNIPSSCHNETSGNYHYGQYNLHGLLQSANTTQYLLFTVLYVLCSETLIIRRVTRNARVDERSIQPPLAILLTLDLVLTQYLLFTIYYLVFTARVYQPPHPIAECVSCSQYKIQAQTTRVPDPRAELVIVGSARPFILLGSTCLSEDRMSWGRI